MVTDDKKSNESSMTDAGVRFVQGANSFSLVGSYGEMENNDASHTAVMGSYARALGPGVKWHANVIWNSTHQSAKAAMVVSKGTMIRFWRRPRHVTTKPVIPALAYPDNEDYMAQMGQAENSGGMAIVTGIKVVF